MLSFTKDNLKPKHMQLKAVFKARWSYQKKWELLNRVEIDLETMFYLFYYITCHLLCIEQPIHQLNESVSIPIWNFYSNKQDMLATLLKVPYVVWLVLQNGSKNNGINTFSRSVFIKAESDRKTFASHPFI